MQGKKHLEELSLIQMKGNYIKPEQTLGFCPYGMTWGTLISLEPVPISYLYSNKLKGCGDLAKECLRELPMARLGLLEKGDKQPPRLHFPCTNKDEPRLKPL